MLWRFIWTIAWCYQNSDRDYEPIRPDKYLDVDTEINKTRYEQLWEDKIQGIPDAPGRPSNSNIHMKIMLEVQV